MTGESLAVMRVDERPVRNDGVGGWNKEVETCTEQERLSSSYNLTTIFLNM